ncbi:putative carbonic anhydrase 3 [Armadillidium nasatum]|uniref:Carbonic anhydrase n=1 Tax=Armadillidium nasatum TaxID=96803 RepID=A0A5N5TF94_9CRUS|nr:putative carbonic anhydrase 3 [Armadillidium nasatum]
MIFSIHKYYTITLIFAASPKNWAELFPSCGGESQSPIALKSSSATPITYPPLEFINFDFTYGSATALNTGHSVQVSPTLPDGEVPKVRGGGLPKEYKLVQFHFHWGRKSNRGSEHTLDGKRYPMEMHLVFIGTEYKDFNAALNKTNAIAVFSVLFKKSKFDNPILNPLIDVLPDVGSEDEMPVHVFKLLPWDLSSFFRYNGSLTTPLCNEPVIWTVFDSFVPISERQLELYRELEGFDEVNIEDNFRPLQDLNGRTVYKNKAKSRYCRHPFCVFYEKIQPFKYKGYYGWKRLKNYYL